MLIQDVETLDNFDLNIKKRKTKKSQILLFDTQRRFDDYISKLKYRRNGNFEDIPHFVVSKLGLVYQVFDSNYYSNTFNVPNIDKKQIKIAIENLGWLNKNTITGFLNNWIGDPYRTDPYIRHWRNYYYWDAYPEQQISVVAELCNDLCSKHKIFKQIVPSNGYLEKAPNFQGVVCKSNFSNIYTDINPSFNFSLFFKNAAKEIIK